MNKPLPWNVKGVGFDAREAARLAAKRAGKPLGEWLNDVISARAAELGVQVDDVESEDRLEAIAARLSRDGTEPTAMPARQTASPDDVMAQRDSILPPAGAGLARPSDLERPAMPQPLLRREQLTESAGQIRFPASAAAQEPSRNATPAPGGQREAGRGATADGRTASRTPAEVDRLDERLNTILAKLNRSFDAAGESGSLVALREVERRPVPKAPAPPPAAPAKPPVSRAAASEERKPAGWTAQAPTAPTAPSRPATTAVPGPGAPSTSFADLHNAFHTLAEKLEAQLADAQTPKAQPTLAEPRRALRGQAAEENARARIEDLKQLQRELAQLASEVAELTPQRALASLEAAVRDLAGRVDLSKLDGVQASLLVPVERLGRDMRDAIRSADATSAVEAIRRDMKLLAAKLDAQPSRAPDARALDGLRGEMQDMRQSVSSLEQHLSATARLQAEVSALGDRVGALAERGPSLASREMGQAVGDIRSLLQDFGADGALGALDRKIDGLAARMESMADFRQQGALFTDLVQQIERAHESLVDRLSDRMAPQADVTGLEDRIGSLSAKIDSMGRASQDVNALYGLVGNLADRMQDARDPQADGDTLAALQTQIGQLVERLDRTEAGNANLHGLERLIGDLFLQIEQSRNVAIDAAENAARAAAQDTLRAALDNPALNGAELTVQTGLDVDHVSQELAEMRRVQETSDRRVTATLTALNTTLERLVDHLMAVPPAQMPAEPAKQERQGDQAPRRRRRMAAEVDAFERRGFGDGPSFDPEPFLIEPGSVESARPPLRAETAPVQQVPADSPADVAPLIAAARRAAQAAQASALEAALATTAEGGKAPGEAQPGKARSFFGARRRPLLLGLAGLVLLIGTLQIVRLSTERGIGETAPSGAVANGPAPIPQPTAPAAPAGDAAGKTDGKGALLLNTPRGADVAMSAVPAATDPMPTGSVAPSGPTAELAALGGIGQGLKDLAAGGNPAAQYEVASRLSDGRGMTRGIRLAATWFERAAKLGFAPAQYRLGSVYEKGVGVATDPALAVAWYEKAAAQGNVRAMHNLAVMSAEGAGGRPDYGKAVTWFTKAAGYGVRDSQYNLAVLLARGLGVPQNLGQSYAWFAAAAGQGDSDAVTKRDAVAGKLDAKTLADAKATAAAFRPLAPDAATNDITPPPGGWDAAAPARTAGARKVEARVSSM